jgi:two-component sensor histidine kinase
MNRNLFDQWLKIVEAQLQAARKVDGKGLLRLTRDRMVLQEQLGRSPVHLLPQADRAYAREVVLRIRELDHRIQNCAQIVLDSLAMVAPSSAPVVYNARGYMRGM